MGKDDNTFTWLHFTDIHFGARELLLYGNTLTKQILKDIKKYELEKIDVIFFTGDLVNRGTSDEYKQFSEWLGRVEIGLRDLGLSPILLPVPGNHDLCRPDEDSTYFGFRDQWNKNQAIRDKIWNGKKRKNSEFRLVENAFKNYKAWFNDPDRPFKRDSKIIDGLLPGDFYIPLEIEDGKSIGVVGLNTTMLQLGGGDYEGLLEINEKQFLTFLDTNYIEDLKSKHDILILLSHQPFEWLNERGRNVYTQFVSNEIFDLHLSGHLHDNTITTQKQILAQSDDRFLISIQSSSLFGLEKYEKIVGNDKSEEEERRQGYFLGRVTFGSLGTKLRLWPRKMNKEGIFALDTDLWYKDHNQYFDIDIHGCKGPAIKEIGAEQFGVTHSENKTTIKVPFEEQPNSVIHSRINKIFAKDILNEFKDKLREYLTDEENKKFTGDSNEELVNVLLELPSDDFIISINVASDHIGLKSINDDSNIKKNRDVWECLEQIIGWGILLEVDPEWENHSSVSGKDDNSIHFNFSLTSDAGIEIMYSALRKRHAEFEISDGAVIGKGQLNCSTGEIEDGGLDKESKKIALKNKIHGIVNSGEALPKNYDKTQNDILNGHIKSLFKGGEKKYLLFKNFESKNIMENNELLAELFQELPDLRLVVVTTPNGGNNAVLPSEGKILAPLIRFLKLKPC